MSKIVTLKDQGGEVILPRTSVDAVSGTLAYTLDEKDKLEGIEAGAEVNDTDVVKFSAQELTADAQEQARGNIGAASAAVIGDINTILDNINREVV